MEAHSRWPSQAATTTRSVILTPHSPVRVFLLSDRRLLREPLARVLKNHADILLVGAEEFSAAVAAEFTGSACDVLLVDPINLSAFDAHILAKLSGRFSNLRVLTIEVEAGIADVISSIATVGLASDIH